MINPRYVDGLELRIKELTEKCRQLEKQNAKLLECLSDIQQQCIGEIAMGYKMSAEFIGNSIYEVTGLTEPELRAKVQQGGE